MRYRRRRRMRRSFRRRGYSRRRSFKRRGVRRLRIGYRM